MIPVDDDPLHLTPERLAAAERRRGGSAWRRAIDEGIDTTLLERNLALSPSERLEQLDAMLTLLSSVRR